MMLKIKILDSQRTIKDLCGLDGIDFLSPFGNRPKGGSGKASPSGFKETSYSSSFIHSSK